MQSKPPASTIRIGRVSIQKRADGYLRLRLEIDKTEYVISFGRYSLERLEAAKNKAREIETDIYKERFDPSLEKYRLKPKQPTPINDSVVPIQQEWDIKQVWEFYCEINKSGTAKTTQTNAWKQVESIIDYACDLLALDRTFRFVEDIRAIDDWIDKHAPKEIKEPLFSLMSELEGIMQRFNKVADEAEEGLGFGFMHQDRISGLADSIQDLEARIEELEKD
jgi:hypothetical protein